MEEAVLGLLFVWTALLLLGTVLAFVAVKRSTWLRRESDFQSEKLQEILQRLETLEAWIIDQEYAQFAESIDLPEGDDPDFDALVVSGDEEERAQADPATTPLAGEAGEREGRSLSIETARADASAGAEENTSRTRNIRQERSAGEAGGLEDRSLSGETAAAESLGADHAREREERRTEEQPVVTNEKSAVSIGDSGDETAAPAFGARRAGATSGSGIWLISGALALLLAGAFLFEVLVERSILGVTGGLSLGLIASALCLAAAAWVRRRRWGDDSRRARTSDLAVWLSVIAVVGMIGFVVGASRWSIIPGSLAFLLSILAGSLAIYLLPGRHVFPAIIAASAGFVGPALLADVAAHDAFWPCYLSLWIIGWLHRSRQQEQAGLALFVFLLASIGASTLVRAAAYGGAEVAWVVLPPLALLWQSARIAGAPNALRVGHVGIGCALVLASAPAWLLPGEEMTWLGFGSACALLLAHAGRSHALVVWPWAAAAIGAGLSTAYRLHLAGPTSAAETSTGGWALNLGLTILSLGAMFGAGAYLKIWRSTRPRIMALLLVSATGIYFAVAAWSLPTFPGRLSDAATAAVIAVGLGVLSYPVARRLPSERRNYACTSILLSGAVFFAAWSAWLATEGTWLSAVLSGILLLAACSAGAWRLDGMRPILAALATVVFVRFTSHAATTFMHPIPSDTVLRLDIDFWSYPFAIAAFFVAAVRLDGTRRRNLSRLLCFAVVGLSLSWPAFFCAAFFLRTETAEGARTAAEWGTMACIWFIALGIAARAIAAFRRPSPRRSAFFVALPAFALICTFITLIGLGVIANPMFHRQGLGDGLFFNALFVAFALPGVALILPTYAFSQWSERRRVAALVVGPMSGASFLLIWAFAGLSVRRHFHGDALTTGYASGAEWMGYTLVWTALGLVAVAVGSKWRASWWRQAGMALLVIVSLKLFVSDAVNLEGLVRVASLGTAGLGLLLAGWFVRRAKAARWG